MERSFPAGTGETMQYLTHECNDNTMRFVLRYPGKIEGDILRDAVLALVGSVDILHASYVAGKKHAHWVEREDYTRQDCFACMQTREDPMETAKQVAVQPIRAEGRAKIFCTLIQGQGTSALVLRISHLCADGTDGKYLLGKLTEAYNLRLQTGSCAALQVKNGNRAPEQMYENLTKEEQKALMRNPLTGIKSRFPFPEDAEGTLQACVKIVPAPVMQAARERAREVSATVNDLLLSACYRAYAATPGVEPHAPMSVLGMMDLRRHCRNADALGLCNMTGSLPTVLHNGVAETFEQTLIQIAVQTAKAKEDPYAGLKGLPFLHLAARRLPLALLLKVAGRAYGGMGFGLTNIGNLDCSWYCLGDLRPEGGWFGGPLKKKPSLQISAASFDGACALSIVGEFSSRDAEALTAFLETMAAELTKYATE